MELETLKSVFHHQSERAVRKPASELKKVLYRQSHSEISRLKQNLRIELIAATLFSIFPLFIMIRYTHFSYYLFALMMMIVCVAFIIYAASLYAEVSHFQQHTYSLRETLRRVTRMMNKYMHTYFFTTMLFIPLVFVAAFFMMYARHSYTNELLYFVDWENILPVYTVIFAGWIISMYFFTRWYLHKLYGKHVEALKKTLTDLEAQ